MLILNFNHLFCCILDRNLLTFLSTENKTVPFLIDTGAAVSVLPKHKVLSLLTYSLSSYSIPETRSSGNITAFGRNMVTVEGPYLFNINLLDMSFKHEFYLLYSPTPFIAGFDFIVKAGLVIDPVNRLVWSKCVVLADTVNRSTNLIENDSVLSPYDQIASETNHVNDDNCSSMNKNTLGGSHSRVDENGVMMSIRSVLENSSDVASDVPEHLRILFLTTVENNDLPSDVVHDFKQFSFCKSIRTRLQSHQMI